MRGPRRRARCIGFSPSYTCFKPCGTRGRGLESLEIRADEFEALRLMDHEGLYQEECAQRMGVSRTTLSRMVASARHKVADALLNGKRLLIATEQSTAVGAAAGEARQGLPAEGGARAVAGAGPADPTGRGVPGPSKEESTPFGSPFMKTIVLAADDNRGLAGEMAQHFGRCPFYVVARVNGDGQVEATEVRENPYVHQHEPGQIPRFIHSLGADAIIASGMGHRAISWFEELGVEAVTGSRGQVGATLQAYLNGEMRGAAGCAHDHDHDHDHDHGHDHG